VVSVGKRGSETPCLVLVVSCLDLGGTWSLVGLNFASARSTDTADTAGMLISTVSWIVADSSIIIIIREVSITAILSRFGLRR
jgi:hypothetical protein